jgi:hypothetical protein
LKQRRVFSLLKKYVTESLLAATQGTELPNLFLIHENTMQNPATATRGPLVLAILIITVGFGWLLTAWGYAPGINWIWTLGLGVIGVLTFILSGGVDKLSVVIGPFFLVGSMLSVLRQSERLSIDMELPILVILIGVLIFIAQLRVVPLPAWFGSLSVAAKQSRDT